MKVRKSTSPRARVKRKYSPRKSATWWARAAQAMMPMARKKAIMRRRASHRSGRYSVIDLCDLDWIKSATFIMQVVFQFMQINKQCKIKVCIDPINDGIAIFCKRNWSKEG